MLLPSPFSTISSGWDKHQAGARLTSTTSPRCSPAILALCLSAMGTNHLPAPSAFISFISGGCRTLIALIRDGYVSFNLEYPQRWVGLEGLWELCREPPPRTAELGATGQKALFGFLVQQWPFSF